VNKKRVFLTLGSIPVVLLAILLSSNKQIAPDDSNSEKITLELGENKESSNV
jgi:hypothetical protein